MPLYWDEHAGKMYLEIDRFNQEMLYVTALSAGVGSNELELGRGKMNQAKVVQFVRSGTRVLLLESNYDFRATSPDAAEQRSVRDSFARSVLWGFAVAGEENGRVIVDATAFLLRDAAQVGEQLKEQKQGAYHADPARCAFEMSLTKAFPCNTEIETIVTLTGEPEGKLIRSVTPEPEAVTVREHQAFVALPEPGYEPRVFDPRAGYFSVDCMNFSAPIDQPAMKHYITRNAERKTSFDVPERLKRKVGRVDKSIGRTVVFVLRTKLQSPLNAMPFCSQCADSENRTTPDCSHYLDSRPVGREITVITDKVQYRKYDPNRVGGEWRTTNPSSHVAKSLVRGLTVSERRLTEAWLKELMRIRSLRGIWI